MRTTEFVALISMVGATIAIAIDTVLPAFTEMRAAFGLEDGSPEVAWTVTALFLGLALGQPVYGPLSDRFGRKPVLYAGLAIYVIGALGSTFAPSLGALIASRVVWGFGAAGPQTLSLAIVRDCYVGDRMAKLMSFTVAVFLVVPVIAPSLGELLLRFGSWRWTFGAGVVLALVIAAWLTRLRETLHRQHRLPLSTERIRLAIGEIGRSRATVAYTVALIVNYGAFFPWLGSSQLMIGVIYGRAETFAVIFGATALVMAAAITMSGMMAARLGARRVLVWLSGGLVAVAAATVAHAVTSDGIPPFWTWLAGATAVISLSTAISPLLNTLALEPMGHIAGTAAAAIGTFVFGFGAILGNLIDRSIGSTVTPFSVGFLVYSTVGLGAVLWAGHRAGRAGREVGPAA